MSVLDTKTVLPEFIKLRWNEPYVSSGLNRKTFKTIPRGVYNGFVVKPGPGTNQIQVVHDDVSGWGLTGSYQGGDFDQASGWSIAVHAQSTGYTTNIVIQAGPGRNYVFDVLSYANQTIFPVIDVQYKQGVASAAQVKLVQAADLNLNPDYIVLARIDVPGSGIVSQGNIHYDDSAYPRVLPFANKFKYGYMSPKIAADIEFLEAVSGSPAFNYEFLVLADGPQDITLPPSFTYVVNSDDLWVFKNGLKMTKGASRDYIEVDRGDGRGEKITWVGILRAGDRVGLRIQKYAAVASSTLQVFDEHALIDPNVIFMNFQGAGVQVIPAGPRSVNIKIPGGGGGGGGAIKTKLNNTGVTFPKGYAAHLKSDNTAIRCNPTLGHKLYGLAAQDIAPASYGDFQVAGILTDVDYVSGYGINADLYVSMDGSGKLVTVAGDPVSGSVLSPGFTDGADSVSGGLATDIVFERRRLT